MSLKGKNGSKATEMRHLDQRYHYEDIKPIDLDIPEETAQLTIEDLAGAKIAIQVTRCCTYTDRLHFRLPT